MEQCRKANTSESEWSKRIAELRKDGFLGNVLLKKEENRGKIFVVIFGNRIIIVVSGNGFVR